MHGAPRLKSATIGYQPPGYPAYRGTWYASVNHVVCHSIPNDKPFEGGDIVNVASPSVTEDGWFGDTSRMFLVGECSIAAKRLCALTLQSHVAGDCAVKPGARLGDIGRHSNFAEGMACRWCAICGHGIGKNSKTPGAALWPPRHGQCCARHGLHHEPCSAWAKPRHQRAGQRRLDHHRKTAASRPSGSTRWP